MTASRDAERERDEPRLQHSDDHRRESVQHRAAAAFDLGLTSERWKYLRPATHADKGERSE
jgi:hypothetical protein